ncbi:MAG: histidinol-phosphatase [Proteobacteria bacterium]|nr:histidinol-phosphatase [Pseudomonadota bacterium]
MELMDYHNHHHRCGHALGSIEDYIKVAVEKGLSEIGIADHYPFGAVADEGKYAELIKTISMTVEDFPGYIQEIKDLREKYRGRIAVKISTEVGFVTSGKHLDRQKKLLDPFMDDFDYLLCGVHELKFDGLPIVHLTRGIDPDTLKAHGEDRIHLEYTKKMRAMVETGYFDIVTHLDIHRMLWLPNEPTYSETAWRQFMELLDRIKSKGMAVEINTSGTLKGARSQFPSDDIVKELIRREIPLSLSSDAHRPENIAYQFEEFIEKAKSWGLTHLCAYEKRKQRLIPID